MMPGALLIIDDEADAAESLARSLTGPLSEHRIHCAHDGERALALIKAHHPAVVVMDLSLDPKQGIESGFALLTSILQFDPATRIIVLTGHGRSEYGVRALTRGAANFLQKPADITHLTALIRDGLIQSALRREVLLLRSERRAELDTVVVGSSTHAHKVREQLLFAAQTSQPVLFVGETGTGKGVCAQAVHRMSARSAKRLVRFQPTFSSADLVNSELFGHLRGAFTGALTQRRGLLAEADGGSLFIDEVEALPLETQISLLGVLQEGRYRTVGADSELSSDFRLLCATNEHPRDLVTSERLRADFLHRIAHLTIEIPPLRERREDIPSFCLLLLERIVARCSLPIHHVDQGALELLTHHSWPGNIRELEATIESACYRAQLAGRHALSRADVVIAPSTVHHDQLQRGKNSVQSVSSSRLHDQIECLKRTLVQEAMNLHQGNQMKASQSLGIDRSSLRRILQRADTERRS